MSEIITIADFDDHGNKTRVDLARTPDGAIKVRVLEASSCGEYQVKIPLALDPEVVIAFLASQKQMDEAKRKETVDVRLEDVIVDDADCCLGAEQVFLNLERNEKAVDNNPDPYREWFRLMKQ